MVQAEGVGQSGAQIGVAEPVGVQAEDQQARQ
jgi:hypothetical protein